MSALLTLAQQIEEHYGEQLAGAVETRLDALIVRLDNDVIAELRIAAPDAYAFTWIWGEAELRIDTAPVHPELAGFPAHLHAADGVVRADPITRCGAEPWQNVRTLLDVLLVDPLLER